MVRSLNWTKILAKADLEAPGYHEAVAEARSFHQQKIEKQREELLLKKQKSEKKKLSRGRKT